MQAGDIGNVSFWNQDVKRESDGIYAPYTGYPGGDATEKFEKVGHSDNARALLKPYCIGVTKQIPENEKEDDIQDEEISSRSFERIVIYLVLLFLMSIVVNFRWIPGAILLIFAALANEYF